MNPCILSSRVAFNSNTEVVRNPERGDMASLSHVTTSSSIITHCDRNPAYGLTVPTQTSETEAGDLVGQTGSGNSVAVNQRPPAGEVHTVDVNELQHVYDYANLSEPSEPRADYLTVSCIKKSLYLNR